MPLDGQYRAAGQSHAGLILVSTKTFPQDRSFVGAVAGALAALLDKRADPGRPGHLPRPALTSALSASGRWPSPPRVADVVAKIEGGGTAAYRVNKTRVALDWVGRVRLQHRACRSSPNVTHGFGSEAGLGRAVSKTGSQGHTT